MCPEEGIVNRVISSDDHKGHITEEYGDLKIRHRTYCSDCKQDYPMGFMLSDWVWSKIAEVNEILCIHCARKKVRLVLGRDLKISDFTNCQMNDLVHVGFEIGA